MTTGRSHRVPGSEEGSISTRWGRSFLIAALSAFFCSSCLFALDPSKRITQYVHNVWTTDNGLPQNSVYAILQTRDGYLWMGTEEGLARFDGVRFTVYDMQNTPEMKADQVNALLEDRDGNLWIGTQGGGVLRLRGGKFTSYTSENGLCNDDVWSMLQDRDGNIWIATSGGLNRYRHGKFATYSKKEGLLDETVWILLQDHAGNLWIGTSGGLNRYRADGKFDTYTTKDGLSSNTVVSLCEDPDGNLWIGTSDGLNRLQNGTVTSYSTKDGLTNANVLTLFEDRQANLWIGTFGGVVRRLNGAFEAYTTKDGLSNDVVTRFFEDREGSLWIGTSGGGLNRLRDGKFTNYSTQEGLSNDNAEVSIQDRDGSLWIGTYVGLNHFQNGKWTTYTTHDGLTNDNVRSLFQDSAGTLWIGTYGGGLNCFRNGKFSAYTTKEGLSHNKVWSLYEDRHGNLWAGTSGGLNCFRDGKFTVYTTKNGLSNDHIWNILQDRDENLWIGTFHGLNRYRDGKFTPYTTKEGLSNNDVISLYEDRNKNLWIGTQGGGLDRLKNGKFSAYTTRDGLFNDAIFQILDDGKGNLWMSCDKGIFRVSIRDLDDFDSGKLKSIHCISYGKSDGMKSQECDGGSEPAGCRTAKGELWFPTIAGMTMIDPGNIKTNTIPPPVVIESFIADQQTIPIAEQNNSPYTIEPGRQKFEFHYTALSFLSPEMVDFKYKLEGLDADWVDAATRRTAYYTNVRPGSYTFRVKASNNDGVWSETGASVAFVLQPRFYQTLWFYALCALSLVFIGWNLNRYRLGRALELERVRSRIAADLHDDIGSGLSQISILSEVVRRDPADSQSVSKIAATSREMVDSMSDIVWAVNPNRDRMTDLVQRMRYFASDILAARNIAFQFSTSGFETDRTLDPELRRDVYLIFKESLNNSVRHSDCTKAEISLALQDGSLILRVSDNGKGFAQQELSHGHGLASMRGRAANLGGKLELHSEPGTGTVVQLNVPLRRPRSEIRLHSHLFRW